MLVPNVSDWIKVVVSARTVSISVRSAKFFKASAARPSRLLLQADEG